MKFKDARGYEWTESWPSLGSVRVITDGEIAVLSEPLRPLWDALDEEAKRVALFRLEVVQEIVTGYREGHKELAFEGEPRYPFGPDFGKSESKRCEKMALILSMEGRADRILQQRVRDGELQSASVSSTTVRNWVRSWRSNGLRGLIDGRSLRSRKSWEAIDPRFRAGAEEVIASLDGDRSTVSIAEIERRTRVLLREQGVLDPVTPQRITAEYLSSRKAAKGATTRSQRSRSLRGASGYRHFPALRPGQVIAIDATRADCLVYDPFSGHPCSVEILTAIDVATRVVLALRVTAKSANGFDAGILLYDICRPFSLSVSGTTISDWRWVGLPNQVDMTSVAVRLGKRVIAPELSTLDGEHPIPSVMPDAVRCDHGSIFLSTHFGALLRDLGIDLLLSRGSKPTDNPHVERWHETIQRALQQIPGYKGRNTSERGRIVSEEPLLTARELEEHLRRFIALDYHRALHEGLILPGAPDARLCPLEMWDVMVAATGRIDVPQHPDLVYQFLPIKWAKIGHDGVEIMNLTYNAPLLRDYGSVRTGFFREQDRAAPFFVDPHDRSRIWFRDPESQRIVPIPWKGASKVDAPMASTIVDAACRRIRERGGNDVLQRNTATRQIIESLGEITRAADSKEWKSRVIAARRRVDQSHQLHAEAQAAAPTPRPGASTKPNASREPAEEPFDKFRGAWPNLMRG
ncbi:MAG: hypothetical protein K1X67_04815 [Fimbriimonadaceae bacterium]|nr:hypothetical protein [Fimbriimonadaceae bacterium]